MKPQTVYMEISVKERLPETEGKYWLIFNDGVMGWEDFGDFSFEYESFMDNNNRKMYPTHWLEKREVVVLTPEEVKEEINRFTMKLTDKTPEAAAMQKLIHDTNSATSQINHVARKLREFLNTNIKQIETSGINTSYIYVACEYFLLESRKVKKAIDAYYIEFQNDFKHQK